MNKARIGIAALDTEKIDRERKLAEELDRLRKQSDEQIAALIKEFGDVKTAATMQSLQAQEERHLECEHKKGGNLTPNRESVENAAIDDRALLHGDSKMYALIKHELPTGRWMVVCQRCNKIWYSIDPVTDEPATPGFEEAFNFPTDNTPSGSGVIVSRELSPA